MDVPYVLDDIDLAHNSTSSIITADSGFKSSGPRFSEDPDFFSCDSSHYKPDYNESVNLCGLKHRPTDSDLDRQDNNRNKKESHSNNLMGLKNPQSHNHGPFNDVAVENLDVKTHQEAEIHPYTSVVYQYYVNPKHLPTVKESEGSQYAWTDPLPLSQADQFDLRVSTPSLQHPIPIDERDSGEGIRAEDSSPSALSIQPQSISHTSELKTCFDQRTYSDESEPAHLLTIHRDPDNIDWRDLQMQLPECWRWDVDCEGQNERPYTSTSTHSAGRPVVLLVEYACPPLAGGNPPPDPRSSALIDCTAETPFEVIRDVFLMFTGSLGLYLLVNGVLQIIVNENFDKEWAALHLPHKYGGLKVCYVARDMEPTMFPSSATPASNTRTIESKRLQTQTAPSLSLGGPSSNLFQFSPSRLPTDLQAPSLQLNDFIEARTKSSHKKEKFAGRIGAKVVKSGEPYLIMSSHVVTETILAKSHLETFFKRSKNKLEKFEEDWNEHVNTWAGDEKIGTIERTFDPNAEIYPNGFMHDMCLIKPANLSSVKNIQSPIPNLGWQSRESWNSLRQQSSTVKILGVTEDHRAAKTLKTNRPSEVLVVSEGIFLNQTVSPRPRRDHDISTWKDLVSRALLYRVYPDFDPPNGQSGVAIYTDGLRDDGTMGPGIVGFQSFVQRSGHVQNFEMEGVPLEAFQVPDVLRREYGIV